MSANGIMTLSDVVFIEFSIELNHESGMTSIAKFEKSGLPRFTDNSRNPLSITNFDE